MPPTVRLRRPGRCPPRSDGVSRSPGRCDSGTLGRRAERHLRSAKSGRRSLTAATREPSQRAHDRSSVCMARGRKPRLRNQSSLLLAISTAVLARRAAVEKACTSVGGSLETFYYAFGDTDGVAVVDLPDNSTAAGLALLSAASGTIGQDHCSVASRRGRRCREGWRRSPSTRRLSTWSFCSGTGDTRRGGVSRWLKSGGPNGLCAAKPARSPCRTCSLRRAVVTTSPSKNQPEPVVRQPLYLVCADVAMLLAVAHHNGQLVRLSVDRVLPSVHGSEPEHGSLYPVAAHIRGHERQRHRRSDLLQRTVPSRWDEVTSERTDGRPRQRSGLRCAAAAGDGPREELQWEETT